MESRKKKIVTASSSSSYWDQIHIALSFSSTGILIHNSRIHRNLWELKPEGMPLFGRIFLYNENDTCDMSTVQATIG